jgi:hypothetical protein
MASPDVSGFGHDLHVSGNRLICSSWTSSTS